MNTEFECSVCGHQFKDWTLLPHELFNETCPGGNGMLCFPCFVKKTKAHNQHLRTVLERLKANPYVVVEIEGRPQRMKLPMVPVKDIDAELAKLKENK